MRKKNMFGIILKEEWKLTKKTFLIFIGVILGVNILTAILVVAAGLRPETVLQENGIKIFGLGGVSLFFFMQLEAIALFIMPFKFAGNLNRQLFVDDSSFLYKMLPVNGFELLGAKLLLAAMQFALVAIVIILSAMLIGVEVHLIFSDKLNFHNFFSEFSRIVAELFESLGGRKAAVFSLRILLSFFFFSNLTITFSAIKNSFNLKVNNALITVVAYVVFFLIIQYIWQIQNNIVACVIPTAMIIATFVGNCLLFEKKVGV